MADSKNAITFFPATALNPFVLGIATTKGVSPLKTYVLIWAPTVPSMWVVRTLELMMGALYAPSGAKARPAMFLIAVAMVLTITGCGELPLGDFHPELKDIQQSEIGDCGLLSVAGSFAIYYPDVIKRRLPKGTKANWQRELEAAYEAWGGTLEGAQPFDVYHFFGTSSGFFLWPKAIPENVPAILCTGDHTTVLVNNHCYTIVSATELYNPWGYAMDIEFEKIKNDINIIYFVRF